MSAPHRTVMGEGSYHYVGWDSVHKFGYVSDVDTTTVPEDVWVVATGSINFPATTTETTIISSDASDTNLAGTGAWAVTVEGIDSDGNGASETVNVDGTGTVTLSGAYASVFRAFVNSAGSGGANAGDIDVLHGSTILARIGSVDTAGANQTLQAGYQIPADYKKGILIGWSATAGRVAAGRATVALKTRSSGGVWQIKDVKDVQTDGGPVVTRYPIWQEYDPGTQFKLTVEDVSANDMTVSGQIDILLVSEFW